MFRVAAFRNKVLVDSLYMESFLVQVVLQSGYVLPQLLHLVGGLDNNLL